MTKHQFDPGDHRLPVDEDHLCHDCGQSRRRGDHKDEQPLPTANDVEFDQVEPRVIEAVREHAANIHWAGTVLTERIEAEFRKRFELGQQRYGVKLTAFNNRDALRDCLDELLDAYNYLTQDLMQGGLRHKAWAYTVLNLIFDIEHERMTKDRYDKAVVSAKAADVGMTQAEISDVD